MPVPVFGPYAYGWRRNLADMVPKIMESTHSGARKIFFDRQFLSLASAELRELPFQDNDDKQSA